MAVPILTRPFRTGFFESKRQQLLSYYSIPSKRQACPKIVYVDRQKTNRRMPDETHEGFMAMLRGLEEDGYGRVEWVRAEDMGAVEQVRAVADATVSKVSGS
jgi:hypothetical protein